MIPGTPQGHGNPAYGKFPIPFPYLYIGILMGVVWDFLWVRVKGSHVLKRVPEHPTDHKAGIVIGVIPRNVSHLSY